MGRKRGFYPACLRIARRTARMEKRRSSARVFIAWNLTLGGCYNVEAAGLRRVVTGRRNGKWAQLDQGQHGIDSGSCDEVKRLSYDVVTGRRVLRLRLS